MSDLRLTASFASVEGFLAAFEQQIAHGGLLVLGAAPPVAAALSPCFVAVVVGAEEPVLVPAQLASAAPGLGVTVLFPERPEALHALAARLRAAPAEAAPEPQDPVALEPQEPAALDPQEPAADQPHPPDIKRGLSLPERIKHAQTCDREQRFAMLRDPNKQLHAMVLKNPRLGLDEVQWAARLNTLSPEALKIIADHPEWGQNPSVATALVKNPKTPVPVALKLLPRLPAAELRALAKSQGKPQLVQAARKLILR